MSKCQWAKIKHFLLEEKATWMQKLTGEKGKLSSKESSSFPPSFIKTSTHWQGSSLRELHIREEVITAYKTRNVTKSHKKATEVCDVWSPLSTVPLTV